VSFCSGVRAERHVRLEVACEPSSSKAFGGFLQGGCDPAHRHRGRAPSLHVAADPAHRAHDILDDVGTGERERRSSFGSPSRVTVRISSMPGDHPDGRHRRAGLRCNRPVPYRRATDRSAAGDAAGNDSSLSGAHLRRRARWGDARQQLHRERLYEQPRVTFFEGREGSSTS
jgi:hypothetical protein